MINFGDIKGLGDVEITEPIAKANEISQKAFFAGLQHIETNLKEENEVQRTIADELYKSGKVDFVGGSVPAFKNRYETEKKKLVNAMKSFSSVQSFLSNGGYEKITEFKNNLENSEEYRNGVISKVNFETYNFFKRNKVGDEDIIWENGNDIQKFMKGETDKLEFGGVYNQSEITPEMFVSKKFGDQDLSIENGELNSLLTTARFSPKRILEAINFNTKSKESGGQGFMKQYKDPDFDIKQQQLEITKDQNKLDTLRKQKELESLDLFRKNQIKVKKQLADQDKTKEQNRKTEKEQELKYKKDINEGNPNWEVYKANLLQVNLSDMDIPEAAGFVKKQYTNADGKVLSDVELKNKNNTDNANLKIVPDEGQYVNTITGEPIDYSVIKDAEVDMSKSQYYPTSDKLILNIKSDKKSPIVSITKLNVGANSDPMMQSRIMTATYSKKEQWKNLKKVPKTAKTDKTVNTGFTPEEKAAAEAFAAQLKAFQESKK